MNYYIDNIFQNLPKIYEKKSNVKNISTCMEYMDRASGGIDNGTITTILGFTGSRKNDVCNQYSL